MKDEKKGTITRDPELAVLALLDRKLTGLSEEARKRVLTWLVQKHNPAPKETANGK